MRVGEWGWEGRKEERERGKERQRKERGTEGGREKKSFRYVAYVE